MTRLLVGVLLMTITARVGALAAQTQPIIDVHFHAVWWQPGMREPLTGFVAPNSLEELRLRNIAELNRFNVRKVVVSGDQLEAYRTALGERMISGIVLAGHPAIRPDSLRALFRTGRIAVLGEFAPQYAGLAPNDTLLEPYWSLAEELDMPVGIHIGLGPLGAAYQGNPDYRMALSDALLLEDVLIRHPRLRVYVMHAGWPLLDNIVGLLYAHPQVYVDIAVINWVLPRPEFEAYLRRLVDAGFADRIMFGSDNMVWPQSFAVAVDRVVAASFLTAEQRQNILCRNAMRFFRLDRAVCEPE